MSDLNQNTARANILSDALPYIQHYRGRVIVVKYGGAAMQSEELKNAVMSDVVLLSQIGMKIVLVHGGGPEINALLERMGKIPRFENGLRVTDEETIDAVQMTLAGKVNKDLVSLLHTNGGSAIGLSGLDGGMLFARQLKPELGFVGDITRVNPKVITTALDGGYIPVIATVASDENGENLVYNINADVAAARIADSLGAESLILMTDVAGLLKDRNDPASLIFSVQLQDVPLLKAEGVISGGMIPKVDCCVEAVRRSVRKANIIDGRIPHSILIELLTNEGAGTMFVKQQLSANSTVMGL